ncbi:MAG: hypothetical protein ABWK01_05965 [Infirmifilum sp.]
MPETGVGWGSYDYHAVGGVEQVGYRVEPVVLWAQPSWVDSNKPYIRQLAHHTYIFKHKWPLGRNS